MTRDQVTKYFEVRLFSLALLAVMILIVCIFLFFLFISREQYVYASGIAALMVVLVLAAVRLVQYGKTLRRSASSTKRLD